MPAPTTEGWEWLRIQEAPCPQCGLHPSTRAPADLGPAAVDAAAAWNRMLLAADPAALRTSPAPGVWNPMQYAMHVRDMLRVFGERIELAVGADDPAVPWFDPGEDGRHGYTQAEPADAAAAIVEQSARFAGAVSTIRPGDWQRTVRRDGTDRFTVAGLACFAVHEAHHHLLDAEGRLPR